MVKILRTFISAQLYFCTMYRHNFCVYGGVFGVGDFKYAIKFSREPRELSCKPNLGKSKQKLHRFQFCAKKISNFGINSNSIVRFARTRSFLLNVTFSRGSHAATLYCPRCFVQAPYRGIHSVLNWISRNDGPRPTNLQVIGAQTSECVQCAWYIGQIFSKSLWAV